MYIFVLNLVNIFGLIVNFIGVAMMFKANPKVSLNIGFLPNEKDLEELGNHPKNNRLFRRGMVVLAIGFFVQLVSLVLTSLHIYVQEVKH